MHRYLLIIVAAVVGTAAFLPGVAGPFLLDDVWNLRRARAPSGEVADFIDAVIRNGSGLLRRPVSNASFLANYHTFGFEPVAYKAVNIAIHLLSTLVMWLLARRLLHLFRISGPAWVAPFAAALWMLHPIQVSTVLYAVQRMTQLSALFTALFVAYCVRKVTTLQSVDASARHLLGSGLGALALLALATLSKENGALAPFLLGVALLCAPGDQLKAAAANHNSRRFLVATVLAPLLLGCLVAPFALHGVLGSYEARDFSMLQRVLTQPFVLAHYIFTIIVPLPSNMGLYLDFFDPVSVSDWRAWGAAVFAVVTVLVAYLLRERARLLSFAVLWYAVAHSMESTILPLEMAFEHRNHLALFGPVLAFAYYVRKMALRFLLPRQAALLSLIPLLVLAGTTAHRSHTWSNIELFTLNEVRNHPDSSRASTQAAARAAAHGDLDLAVTLIRRAQTLRPNSFWMQAYDIHLACVGAPVEIHWDSLLEQARKRPDERGFEEALRPPVTLLAEGSCEAVDAARFDSFLAQVSESLQDAEQRGILERLNILRAVLAKARGDEARARALLEQAAVLNPKGLDALMRLAYAALNSGDLRAAESYADALDARIGSFHRLTIRFQVRELRNFIALERASANSSGERRLPGPQPQQGGAGQENYN